MGGGHLAAAVDADAVAGGSLSMTKSGVCSKRPSRSRTSLRQRRITGRSTCQQVLESHETILMF